MDDSIPGMPSESTRALDIQTMLRLIQFDIDEENLDLRPWLATMTARMRGSVQFAIRIHQSDITRHFARPVTEAMRHVIIADVHRWCVELLDGAKEPSA